MPQDPEGPQTGKTASLAPSPKAAAEPTSTTERGNDGVPTISHVIYARDVLTFLRRLEPFDVAVETILGEAIVQLDKFKRNESDSRLVRVTAWIPRRANFVRAAVHSHTGETQTKPPSGQAQIEELADQTLESLLEAQQRPKQVQTGGDATPLLGAPGRPSTSIVKLPHRVSTTPGRPWSGFRRRQVSLATSPGLTRGRSHGVTQTRAWSGTRRLGLVDEPKTIRTFKTVGATETRTKTRPQTKPFDPETSEILDVLFASVETRRELELPRSDP